MSDNLLIAAIAAGAALLGSAVGQLGPVIQHWLSVRKERRAFLRERYQQMATLSTTLAVHLTNQAHLSGEVQRGSEVDRGRTEASIRSSQEELFQASLQAKTLALLYFPELLASMTELHKAAGATMMALVERQGEEANKATDRFAAARSTAEAQIQQYASKYA